MKRTDLAYAAGIIDGEGYIGITVHRTQGRKPYYQMRVRVKNTNEWLIQWLRFGFGGSFYTHPILPYRKPVWEWGIETNKASAFLHLIYPYLQFKKPQAELAIRFQEAKHKRGPRHLTEEEMALEETQRILMSNMHKE